MSAALAELVRHSALRLHADPSRVVTNLFVPGQEGFDHSDSRAAAVVARVLALDESEVDRSLADVVARFGTRHRELLTTLFHHADEIADRLDPAAMLSDNRRLLLGATFTSEYAIEGAALCNPSMVRHPDQSDLGVDEVRVVMSVRAIGEGHRSAIGFRSLVLDSEGGVRLEAHGRLATKGVVRAVALESAIFRGELRRLGSAGESADFVLDPLGERFSAAELEGQIARLQQRSATRRQALSMIARLRAIAERSYGVDFAEAIPLSERTLVPTSAAESRGMEDARFVRFADGSPGGTYFASYTAYDGSNISQQLLETRDFHSFNSSPLVGGAASNKGLALFPRLVGGRFAALSRSDRETNSLAWSENLHCWADSSAIQLPSEAWESLQLGNCGSPIETEAGWLVLTHGVGPMRTYRIGAILLDLDDPTRLIGRLRAPLLEPSEKERDGYVPNVVYSCGSYLHQEHLFVPYGIGDRAIGFATVPVAALLEALVAS